MFRQIVAIPIGTNCAPFMAYTVINFNSIFVRVLLTYLDMNSLEILHILISRRLSELSLLFYRMYDFRLCQCLLRREAPFIKPEVWGISVCVENMTTTGRFVASSNISI